MTGFSAPPYEQNETLFKVLKENLMEPLGKEVFNFTLPKAFSYFINASDTHKLYQTTEILLHNTTSEFCKQYVKYCNKSSNNILPEGCIEGSVVQKTKHLP